MGKKRQPEELPAIIAEYESYLIELKDRVKRSQVKAALVVNSELIGLYWELGKSITELQEKSGWGDALLDRLSKDMMKAFPDMKGFSRRNLYRARALYHAYSCDSKFVPQAVAQIPWGHNVTILEKVKDPVERNWYALKTTEYGWSRAILVHQIETNLYHRQGRALQNFEATLPSPQSDLAQEILKDPYNFDFLTLDREAHEKDLEKGLLEHIRSFLLELGTGFAFVGSQVHLEVAGDDFFIDLLFYHLKLRCYIVIDLKVVEFKPEYAGKMSFYLAVVDDIMRHADDKPTIGMILCKTKNQAVAEYTLREINKPIGISDYLVTESIPDAFKGSLPTIEELEAELDSLALPEKDNSSAIP